MCTVSCGGGVRNRTRNCDNPVPSDAGKDCINNDSEQGACYTQNCPIRKFAHISSFKIRNISFNIGAKIKVLEKHI